MDGPKWKSSLIVEGTLILVKLGKLPLILLKIAECPVEPRSWQAWRCESREACQRLDQRGVNALVVNDVIIVLPLRALSVWESSSLIVQALNDLQDVRGPIDFAYACEYDCDSEEGYNVTGLWQKSFNVNSL